MARPSLERNVKYKALVRRLGLPKPFVRGLLETLWDVANECGNPVLGDEHEVEAAAEWPGEVGALFAALRDGRWIETNADGRWQIHDYFDHCPDYVGKRKEREDKRKHRYAPRQRQSSAAWRKEQANELDSLIQPNSELGTTPAPAPLLGEVSPNNPSCSEPDKPDSEPEENEDAGLDRTSIEPPSRTAALGEQPAADAASGELDPAVLAFPIVGVKVGSGPTEWSLRESKLREYVEAFPGVDVLGECRKALQWLRDNPTRRKTFRGMGRYLGGWLERAQNRARTGNGYYQPGRTPGPASPSPTEAEREAERLRKRQERERSLEEANAQPRGRRIFTIEESP